MRQPIVSTNIGNKVFAHCSKDSAQSIGSYGYTPINYNVVHTDSYGCITTGGSWKFTAPITSVYTINSAGYAGTLSVSRYREWWLCKNGHSWKTRINHRSNGSGCPVCRRNKTLC